MNAKVLFVFVAAAAMVACFATSASAVPNSGFEADVVSDGVNTTTRTNWQVGGGTDANDSMVIRNPTSDDFTGGSTVTGLCRRRPVEVKRCSTARPTTTTAQFLTSPYIGTLQRNTTYTLTVAIGRGKTDPLGWFAGFSLLFADDSTGIQIQNTEFPSSQNPTSDEFVDFTATFNTAPFLHSLLVGRHFDVGAVLGAGTYADSVTLTSEVNGSGIIVPMATPRFFGPGSSRAVDRGVAR